VLSVKMAMFSGSRGLGSGILRPLVIVVVLCFLMFLLYAYNSTNTELKQHKERGERLARQQETLKTQIRGNVRRCCLYCKSKGALKCDLEYCVQWPLCNYYNRINSCRIDHCKL